VHASIKHMLRHLGNVAMEWKESKLLLRRERERSSQVSETEKQGEARLRKRRDVSTWVYVPVVLRSP